METLKDFELIQKQNEGDFDLFSKHSEASDYSGCEYSYNGFKIVQRTAKWTPKKTGQFVTLWRRCVNTGKTSPYHVKDDVDFVVIVCFDGFKCGHFLFSKGVLSQKGIFADGVLKKGKRGFRIYPPWTTPISQQAVRTQEWQVRYFSTHLKLEMSLKLMYKSQGNSRY